MDLSFTPDELAFREEVRHFFRTEIPENIRNKVLEGRHLTKEEIITSQRILNARGWAVPNWPKEWGGQGWSPVQVYMYQDEMQQAGVPSPLGLQHLDGGAGDRAFRHAGSRKSASCRAPPTSTTGGARAFPSRAPGRTSPACARRRSASATPG